MHLVLTVFLIFMFLAMILSWVVALTRPPEWLYPFYRFVMRATEPVLAPVRRVIPPLRMGGMGVDVSFTLVFFIVYILWRSTAY